MVLASNSTKQRMICGWCVSEVMLLHSGLWALGSMGLALRSQHTSLCLNGGRCYGHLQWERRWVQ